jgi:hypothetical protein
MASYELIPTDDSGTVDTPPIKTRPKPLHRKLFLLAVAFCVVAFGFYKAGQWSVLRHQGVDSNKTPTTVHKPGQDTSTSTKGNTTKVPTNNTDMPENGRYSVG